MPTLSIKETISAHNEGEDLPRMGGEREDTRLLKDLRWRIDDVRDMLMSRGFGDERIYGCDEWSTPTVNLQTAINVIDKAIAATDVPVGIASNFPEDSQIIAAFEGIERSVASIPEGVEGYLEDLSEAIDATRVVVQAIRNRTALSAAPQSDAWISVDERLPAHEQEVICTGFEGDDPAKKRWMEFAAFHENGTFHHREVGDELYPPTHWREMLALPTPPKTQGQSHGE